MEKKESEKEGVGAEDGSLPPLSYTRRRWDFFLYKYIHVYTTRMHAHAYARGEKAGRD